MNKTCPRPYRLSRRLNAQTCPRVKRVVTEFPTSIFAAKTCRVLSYHEKAIFCPFSLQKGMSLFIPQHDQVFESGSFQAGWEGGRETVHFGAVWAACGKPVVT